MNNDYPTRARIQPPHVPISIYPYSGYYVSAESRM